MDYRVHIIIDGQKYGPFSYSGNNASEVFEKIASVVGSHEYHGLMINGTPSDMLYIPTEKMKGAIYSIERKSNQ